MRINIQINEYIQRIKDVYATLDTIKKNLAADYYYLCIAHLKMMNYQAAFTQYRLFCIASRGQFTDIDQWFHSLLYAEDVVNSYTAVLINTDSPFKDSLIKLGVSLGFDVLQHNLKEGVWTKDFLISTGHSVHFPHTPNKSSENSRDKVTSSPYKPSENQALYYGKLGIDEHHSSRYSASSSIPDWLARSTPIITHSSPVSQTFLEGGNFFCARNKEGRKFYLVGENAVSETMQKTSKSREEVILILSGELCCSERDLLIIPQWTYHLDLQMAYLGRGQFIIHSFEQDDFDFDISESETHCKDTFSYLRSHFEKSIIDTACEILIQHGFNVQKVFGCLFYAEDTSDEKQLKYMPYCKHDEDIDGAIASLMNGLAGVSNKGKHYFLTTRCENKKFKKQFEAALEKLDTEVYYVDMECFYVHNEFDFMLAGLLMGITSPQHYIAFMNGALRCQTSILPKALLSSANFTPRQSQDSKSASFTCTSEAKSVATRSHGNSPIETLFPPPPLQDQRSPMMATDAFNTPINKLIKPAEDFDREVSAVFEGEQQTVNNTTSTTTTTTTTVGLFNTPERKLHASNDVKIQRFGLYRAKD